MDLKSLQASDFASGTIRHCNFCTTTTISGAFEINALRTHFDTATSQLRPSDREEEGTDWEEEKEMGESQMIMEERIRAYLLQHRQESEKEGDRQRTCEENIQKH